MHQKRKSARIPQGGWGVGSKEPTRVAFYYTRLQLNRKYHLVLIQDEPKCLQNNPKVNMEDGETPGGL